MKQHSTQFLSLVNEARKRIKEITPEILKDKIDGQEQFYLIDVREDSEWPTGFIPTATHIGKGIIERDIEKLIPDLDTPIVVYCSGGFRSALTADSLQRMGYSHVHSLGGGLKGWSDAGYELKK